MISGTTLFVRHSKKQGLNNRQMQKTIIKELNKIKKTNRIKIILAIESGSRAWGFPSDNSDYDVRFIYINPKDWYLTIADKRDVIELPIDDLLDINGWDIQKALKLMRKSNPPLLEWLSSPIQYKVVKQEFDKLLDLSTPSFLPETTCHHYLSMAKKYVTEIEKSGTVKLKTYMYAIRSILCCKWIVAYLMQPPMNIFDLLAKTSNDNTFTEIITRLVEEKSKHSEGYRVKHYDQIDTHIREIIYETQNNIPKNPERSDIEIYDDVFRSFLK